MMSEVKNKQEKDEITLSKEVGLFIVEVSSKGNVSLDFKDSNTSEYLNNLYPEWIKMLGVSFNLNVERLINSHGKMEINQLTLETVSNELVKSIGKMPFTLKRMLISHKI